jgi:Ni/Fe-hydrogenase subunit HybB-like protein
MGLTITFSAVDWAMSLAPHWFSTVYGLLFMVGQVLSAMALVIVALALFGHHKPLVDVARPDVVHDLGKLMLAFIMLWAYLNLSQFLIVWSGNLPEEIPWYLQRLHGGWQYLALVMVVFHFVLPFLLLLSRDLKRDARLLALVAAGVLVARLVDLFWLIAPDLQGGHGASAHHGLSVHWLDFAAPIGMGGLWIAAFARELRGRPLLPLGEPELTEFIETPVHAGH